MSGRRHIILLGGYLSGLSQLQQYRKCGEKILTKYLYICTSCDSKLDNQTIIHVFHSPYFLCSNYQLPCDLDLTALILLVLPCQIIMQYHVNIVHHNVQIHVLIHVLIKFYSYSGTSDNGLPPLRKSPQCRQEPTVANHSLQFTVHCDLITDTVVTPQWTKSIQISL